MIINRVFELVQFVANVEQRGNISPAQFNTLAEMAQLEYISKRVGNIKILNERGVPIFGYESTWRIHEDLRPMVYQEVIPIAPGGNFNYPYGYIWPDAIHKNDFTPIRRITADQYPSIKKSVIKPPTSDYPVVIMRNPYGFIDPYQIGSFTMSYLKTPPIPVWGYGLVGDSDRPVFDANKSVDFSVPTMAMNEIALIILQHVGINLSETQLTSYALGKEAAGV